jgi:CHAT domain-containing protein/tetratricopeptide (TPR) repeat protein
MTHLTQSAGDDKQANTHLLSVCALLRRFDRDLLSVLAGCGEDEIVALLAGALVEPAPDGGYHMRDDVRADLLAQLRAEQPSDELTWQTRFFEHFLREMREIASEERRALAEGECFHHLGELFLLIAARREWPLLRTYVAAVRAAQPVRPRHQGQLSFYEGYIAVRTQEYSLAETLLTASLNQEDVEADLQVQILNALGQVYWLQTRYDRALDYYHKMLAIAGDINSTFYQAVAMTNMGGIYHEIDDYAQALDLTIQSLTIFRALGDRYGEAHALYNIGNHATYLGRWAVAQEHYQEAIHLYEILDIQAGLARLYWGQGFLHYILGRETESETAYKLALKMALSPDHGELSVVMDTSIYLGLLYQTQRRWDNAFDIYDRSLELAAQLGNRHRINLIHYRRGNVFERQGRLDEAMAAYRAALEGIEKLRIDTQAEEIKIGLLGTVQQIYESTVRLCLARGQVAEAFEYVERARSRAFLDMLAAKTPELYDKLATPVVTLAEVQAALPPDALLVEFYTTGVLPRGEALINKIPPENTRLREHLVLPPQVIAFAVTRNHVEVFYPATNPNVLRPQPGDPGPGKRLLRDRLLSQLYDQLIAPLAPLLAGRRLLYLLPHGPLHYVPFMALRSAAGEHLLHEDGPAIALAPSATILLRNCLDKTRNRAGAAFALGYNDEDDACLHYAEAEAAHVARLAGGSAAIGRGPKSATLAAAGREARWLHFAGHAVYDPHDPLGSFLRLGQGDELSARRIMAELELRADLVTLNACTTGVTHVVPGDELLGLPRALLYAGAPTVVCTLWEAADLVSLQVMEHFYTGLLRGQPPAAALRDAQIAIRRMTGRDLLATIERWRSDAPELAAALDTPIDIPPDALDAPIYAEPLYWAPFMLIGRGD